MRDRHRARAKTRLRTIDVYNTEFFSWAPFRGSLRRFWLTDLGFRILEASRKGLTVVVWAVEEGEHLNILNRRFLLIMGELGIW